MADCRLALSFNQHGTTVAPGGELTGEVVVHVDAAVACNGLTVFPEWRTSGSGNVAAGEGEKLVLFNGQWDAGEHRYRFGLRAPLGPFTYDGKLVDVRWTLKARADVPWAIDPKAEAPFTLAAGKNAGEVPYFFGPSYTPPDPKTGACGSVVDLFAEPRLNHHATVQGGVMLDECAAVLRDFVRARRGVAP